MILNYAPLGKRIGGMSESWIIQDMIQKEMDHARVDEATAISNLKAEFKLNSEGKPTTEAERRELEKAAKAAKDAKEESTASKPGTALIVTH